MTWHYTMADMQGKRFDLHRVRDLVREVRPELRFWVRDDAWCKDSAQCMLCDGDMFAFGLDDLDRYIATLDADRYLYECRGDVARMSHPDDLSMAYGLMARLEDMCRPQTDVDFCGLTADEDESDEDSYATFSDCCDAVGRILSGRDGSFDVEAIARICFVWLDGVYRWREAGNFWNVAYGHHTVDEAVTVDA